MYSLVTKGYATLKELRDDYTIEEVLDLYEMLMVSEHNKAEAIRVSAEAAKEGR